MIFVGVDWAEAHNDALVMDAAGAVLGRRRCPVGVAGLAELHALVAEHAADPDEVMVGIEIDRGLLVDSLAGPGYRVDAVNPGGQPLSRSPPHLGRQVGRLRRQAPGRPGAHRCP